MLGEVLTEQEKKIFLNIKEGSVVRRTATGEERYSYVEGRLERVFMKDRYFHGEKVTYWYIDLRDDESGDLYSLGFSYSSNVFKSIILQLASPEGIQTIKNRSIFRIDPYTRNGYEKVQVWGEGMKLNWVVKELPDEKRIGRNVKDDSERMKCICSFVDKVVQCLSIAD